MSINSSSNDPVQTVIDLLSGYAGWTHSAPEVYEQEEVSQQEKISNPDPAIYVWSATDASLDQFDAEYSAIDETIPVECAIWIMGSSAYDTSSRVNDYKDDTIDFLAQYANDNEQQITFHHIRPVSFTDNRSEKVSNMTDHEIATVQANVHNHRDI